MSSKAKATNWIKADVDSEVKSEYDPAANWRKCEIVNVKRHKAFVRLIHEKSMTKDTKYGSTASGRDGPTRP